MKTQISRPQRRQAVLATLGAATLGLAGAGSLQAQGQPPADPSEPARGPGLTFVLVHGGWHGGWCWQEVAPLLRGAGHAVWTPTLTGLGERGHLLTPEVDLDLHVQDVLRVLEYEDLRGVVLVGHSYGGMVVSGVAGQAAERLAQLVYLDAFVPRDGQSLFDALLPERREMYRRQAQEQGDGWRVPAPPPEALGVSDGAQASWLAARLTPQPLRTFEQPLRLPPSGLAEALPRTFIHCTRGPVAPSFAPFAARAGAEPGWRLRELATGHDAMLTLPGDLARLLLEPA